MTRRRVRMRSLPCAVIFDSDEQQTRIHNENELLSVGYQIANTRIPQHSIVLCVQKKAVEKMSRQREKRKMSSDMMEW